VFDQTVSRRSTRVYVDPAAAAEILAACTRELTADAYGTLGEIADGDPPFAARGAFAQAWSVATVLDAWFLLARRDQRLQPARSNVSPASP
jgi:glycogen debranching enzyme